MAKKPIEIDEPNLLKAPNVDVKKFIPKPEDVEAKAPQVDEDNVISEVALRRTKVRELSRMGYTDINHISLILDKGIVTRNGQRVMVACDPKTIESDLSYIAQEDLAADKPYLEKRVQILDRFHYLYQRAFTDYSQAKGPSKNTFLNTAFSVLKTIAEMEGVNTPPSGADARTVGRTAESVREDISTLTKEDREELAATLKKFLKSGRQPKGT